MLQELTNKIKNILPEIDIPSKIFEGVYKSRPITLEDVLRCLGGNRAYFVDSDSGCFYRSNLSKGTYEYLGFNWQLGKPLHEQSEETIKELNKLI